MTSIDILGNIGFCDLVDTSDQLFFTFEDIFPGWDEIAIAWANLHDDVVISLYDNIKDVK